MRHGFGLLAVAALLALAGCQTAGGGLFGQRAAAAPDGLDAGAMWQVRGQVSQELPGRGNGAEFATPVVHRDGSVRTVCGYVTPKDARGVPQPPVPYIGGFAGHGFLLIAVGTTDVAAANTVKTCAERGAALTPPSQQGAPAIVDVPIPRRRAV